MLGKCIKYDIKSRLICLAGVPTAVLVMSVIISLSRNRFEESMEYDVVMVGFMLFFSVAIFGAVAFLLFNTVDKFNKSFFGNEGYLIHTLPVKGSTHIIANFIVDMIQSVVAIVVCVASYALVTFTNYVSRKEELNNIKMNLNDFHNSGSSDGDILFFVILMVLCCLIVYLFIVWVLKLAVSVTKNLMGAVNKMLSDLIAIIMSLALGFVSYITIYAAQAKILNDFRSGLVAEGEKTLTQVYDESMLIVFLIHLVLTIALVALNGVITDRKLNMTH